MKYPILIFCLLLRLYAFAEDPCKNSSHIAIATFGGMTGGDISIEDHLQDTLALTDSCLNAEFDLQFTHLTIMCRDQVMKSIECKPTKKLTPEMIEALRKVHQSCFFYLGDIIQVSKRKDNTNNYSILKMGSPLKFTLR